MVDSSQLLHEFDQRRVLGHHEVVIGSPASAGGRLVQRPVHDLRVEPERVLVEAPFLRMQEGFPSVIRKICFCMCFLSRRSCWASCRAALVLV